MNIRHKYGEITENAEGLSVAEITEHRRLFLCRCGIFYIGWSQDGEEVFVACPQCQRVYAHPGPHAVVMPRGEKPQQGERCE